MKKGFTLMELIIVIIILGILAGIGFGQYTRIIERGRAAEAKSILGQIRGAEEAYFVEYGTYTDIGNLTMLTGLPLNWACNVNNWFSYNTTSRYATDYMLCATRCTAGGKTPNVVIANQYCVSIVANGLINSTPAGY